MIIIKDKEIIGVMYGDSKSLLVKALLSLMAGSNIYNCKNSEYQTLLRFIDAICEAKQEDSEFSVSYDNFYDLQSTIISLSMLLQTIVKEDLIEVGEVAIVSSAIGDLLLTPEQIEFLTNSSIKSKWGIDEFNKPHSNPIQIGE